MSFVKSACNTKKSIEMDGVKMAREEGPKGIREWKKILVEWRYHQVKS